MYQTDFNRSETITPEDLVGQLYIIKKKQYNIRIMIRRLEKALDTNDSKIFALISKAEKSNIDIPQCWALVHEHLREDGIE